MSNKLYTFTLHDRKIAEVHRIHDRVCGAVKVGLANTHVKLYIYTQRSL